MAFIDSPDNRIPRLLRALHTKKGRQEHGLTLVEGPRVIREALAARRLSFVAWCPETAANADEVVALAEPQQVPVHALTARAFAATADTVTPTGIVGAASVRMQRLRDLAVPERAVYLPMHEVRDPGNAGTMVRSASAFGVAAVIAVDDCVDLAEPKVIRATAGAIFQVDLVKARWDEVKGWAREHQVALIAAELGGDVALQALRWPERVAILVGNEAHGLPSEVLDGADLRVRIPMAGKSSRVRAMISERRSSARR